MKINGFDIDDFEGFAYDGCHKIYLYKHYDAEDFDELGYTLYPFSIEFDNNGNAIKKSSELIDCYLNSCLLRFIYACDSLNDGDGEFTTIVPQFAERIEFEGFDEIDDSEVCDYWNGDKYIIEMR